MPFRNPFLKPLPDYMTGWPGGVQDTLVPIAYLASQWTKLGFGTAAAYRQQAWAGKCSMDACRVGRRWRTGPVSHLDPREEVAGLAAADRLRLACSYLVGPGGGLLGSGLCGRIVLEWSKEVRGLLWRSVHKASSLWLGPVYQMIFSLEASLVFQEQQKGFLEDIPLVGRPRESDLAGSTRQDQTGP